MALPLLRVALTGGIATGKSYCLRRFSSLGASVIDADTLARQAVAPGTAGLAAVARRFGPSILDAHGSLDRDGLGRIVFADSAARRDLEAIVHPIVYGQITEWFAAEGARGTGASGGHAARVAIADVPLLFETGHAGDFDRVIVAACDRDEQMRRLVARDGLTAADAERRIAAQLPIATKRGRADYVIDTGGSFADTDRHVDEVWKRLSGYRVS